MPDYVELGWIEWRKLKVKDRIVCPVSGLVEKVIASRKNTPGRWFVRTDHHDHLRSKDDMVMLAMEVPEPEHEVVVHPVEKMDGGVIGYSWSCSCGRVRDGRHRTPEKAVEAGQVHIPKGEDDA